MLQDQRQQQYFFYTFTWWQQKGDKRPEGRRLKTYNTAFIDKSLTKIEIESPW